jgi:hypothetical protein
MDKKRTEFAFAERYVIDLLRSCRIATGRFDFDYLGTQAGQETPRIRTRNACGCFDHPKTM